MEPPRLPRRMLWIPQLEPPRIDAEFAVPIDVYIRPWGARSGPLLPGVLPFVPKPVSFDNSFLVSPTSLFLVPLALGARHRAAPRWSPSAVSHPSCTGSLNFFACQVQLTSRLSYMYNLVLFQSQEPR